MIVVAGGAIYFVSLEDPASYSVGPQSVTRWRLTPSHRQLIVADLGCLSAFDTSTVKRWQRDLAFDGIELDEVSDDLVTGKRCIDPPTEWAPFAVRTLDGADA